MSKKQDKTNSEANNLKETQQKLRQEIRQRGLLVIERAVLEALSYKAMRVLELVKDTGLPFEVIQKVLINMKQCGALKEDGHGVFELNKENALELIDQQNEQSQRNEIEDLINGIIGAHFNPLDKTKSSLFRLKKFWLTELETKLLQAHLSNLDQFFQQITEGRRKNNQEAHELKNKQVVFWGNLDYGRLLKNSLL